jgi:DNA-binding NarL/FixJ family response regulator
MTAKKSAALSGGPVQRSVQSDHKPRVAYAREGASGVDVDRANERRVLIVEDDFLIASDVQASLTLAGFKVVGVASSADEAIQLVAAEHPVLAIVDIRLAGERDGIDLALELFRNYGLRCIFATAHIDSGARKRAAAAAPLGWLAKPYTAGSLVALVQQVWNSD